MISARRRLRKEPTNSLLLVGLIPVCFRRSFRDGRASFDFVAGVPPILSVSDLIFTLTGLKSTLELGLERQEKFAALFGQVSVLIIDTDGIYREGFWMPRKLRLELIK